MMPSAVEGSPGRHLSAEPAPSAPTLRAPAPSEDAGCFDISPARLRTKKLARRLAVRLGQALAGLDRMIQSRRSEGSVRVLTWHRFGTSPLDPCCLEPQAFEAQLDWLREHTHVLTPDEFDAVMSGLMPPPANAVLLTIDDGHASVAAHALPALDRRGLKAVLFVCPMLVSTDEPAQRPSHGGFMGWAALADAAASGHAIAPHGHSHRSLGRLPLAEALDDIDTACGALQARLRIGSPFFSFPFGTRADHSPALAQALAQRGFRYCFTAAHGRCQPRSGSLLLPRVKIEGGNELDLFPHIVRGCIDHWRFVDDTLFLLQQRGRM
jgi:peptidoglycan/xylan/chitin deacetylase (PgdA/CDA1 family)